MLLTVSDYTLEMGKLSDFAGQAEYPLLADLRAQLEKSGYNDANVYFDRGV